MPGANAPAAEVDVDEALVRALLRDQHPDLADLPLTLVANGWDNVIFRLGDDLAVRMPRRELAAPLMANELRWLPELAPRLPLPVPAPVRVGRPGPHYPWSWGISPWFEGSTALATPPADLAATADVLASFLAALHAPAPDDAPTNPVRGVPLRTRDEAFRQRVELLGDHVDGPTLLAAWEEFVAVPESSRPALWIHGDTHPANLVVRDGAVVAVIDFGDMAGGDCASDLCGAWMLFDADDRRRFRDAYADRAPLGLDADTWRRARGWALQIGLAMAATSADHPDFEALGHRTIAAALAAD